MKETIFYGPNTFGAPFFSVQDTEEQTLFIDINCAGNSLATAAFAGYPSNAMFTDVRINASFVDASNFGLIIGSAFTEGNLTKFPIKYTVFANGPNGDSITIFLPAGTFVDGTTSVSIPCGSGKVISPINGNPVSTIWGRIG